MDSAPRLAPMTSGKIPTVVSMNPNGLRTCAAPSREQLVVELRAEEEQVVKEEEEERDLQEHLHPIQDLLDLHRRTTTCGQTMSITHRSSPLNG